jgi:hypothetical protein
VIDPRFDFYAPGSIETMARILDLPGVTGIQLLRERPVCVGVRRDARWSWWSGPSLAAALRYAEAAIMRPVDEEDTAP